MAKEVKILNEGESIEDQLDFNRNISFDGEAFDIDWTDNLVDDLRWMAEQDDLCQYMTEEARHAYGVRLLELVAIDDASRADWVAGALRGMDLTSDNPRPNIYDGDVSDLDADGDDLNTIKPRYPLISQAVIEFASQAGDALLSDPRPVKASLPSVAGSGNNPNAIAEAQAISDALSWQLMTVDKTWLSDTDRLIHMLACAGTVFRKRWVDRRTGRNMSKVISGLDVIVNNDVSHLDKAPRVAEEFSEYPHVIRQLIQEGIWYDVDINAGSRSDDWHAPIDFVEVHTWLDLDADGADEPYKVVIQKETGSIVHLSAGWSENGFTVTDRGVLFEQIQEFAEYHFIPDFEGKFYSKGFGHLLGPLSGSINELLASIIETAQLNNENSGLIGRIGTGVSDTIEVRRNKFTVVPTDGQTLQQQVVRFDTRDVSPAMFSVLGLLTEAGQRLSSTVNLMEASGNMPAATAMAITDQGARIYSAIIKRLWAAMGNEFTILYNMNRATMKGGLTFEVEGKQQSVTAEQFQPVRDVQLSADPRLASAAHRAMLAGHYTQFIGNPNTNQEELLKRIHELMRVPAPDALIIPPPQQMPPQMEAQIAELKSKVFEREVKAKLVGAQAANEIVNILSTLTTLAPNIQGREELAASYSAAYAILQQIATLGATNDLANTMDNSQPAGAGAPAGPPKLPSMASGPGNAGVNPASLVPPTPA